MYFILYKAFNIWRVYVHTAEEEPYFIDEMVARKICERLKKQSKNKVQYKLVRVVDTK